MGKGDGTRLGATCAASTALTAESWKPTILESTKKKNIDTLCTQLLAELKYFKLCGTQEWKKMTSASPAHCDKCYFT